MINNMTIAEILKSENDSAKRCAEKYLNSKKVHSVKHFYDGLDSEFEAFIEENPQGILMPYLAMGDGGKVTDIHCQCDSHEGFCVHEIALLIAAQFMIEANYPDYHMAQKLQTAKVLEGIFFS